MSFHKEETILVDDPVETVNEVFYDPDELVDYDDEQPEPYSYFYDDEEMPEENMTAATAEREEVEYTRLKFRMRSIKGWATRRRQHAESMLQLLGNPVLGCEEHGHKLDDDITELRKYVQELSMIAFKMGEIKPDS